MKRGSRRNRSCTPRLARSSVVLSTPRERSVPTWHLLAVNPTLTVADPQHVTTLQARALPGISPTTGALASRNERPVRRDRPSQAHVGEPLLIDRRQYPDVAHED